jgi:hypothetical protein
MSFTTPSDLAQDKRNAKLWYEQLMAQKKARLSQTTTAVPIAPAPKSRSTTTTATASSSKKQQQQQQQSSRESPRRTTTREASKSPKTASPKNRTAANNDAVQVALSSHTKAKAWYDRTYNSGGTATAETSVVSAVPRSGAKISTGCTKDASAKDRQRRHTLSRESARSSPNKTTLDSEANAKTADIRKA